MGNDSELAGLVTIAQKHAGRIWDKYGPALLLTGCFLVPLKLSLTYILFGPVIALWLFANLSNLSAKLKEYDWYVKPWACFVLAFFVSSLFGMQPVKSISSLYSFIFYPVIIFAIADRFGGKKALIPLCSMLLGQSLAAIHTVIESSSAVKIPRFFLGEVTEAGQLAISLPLACGFAIAAHRFSGIRISRTSFVKNVSIICLFTFILTYLPMVLKSSGLIWWQSILIMLSTVAALFAVSHAIEKNSALELPGILNYFLPRFKSIILSLLIAALILNLKRGPWAGCMAALMMLMFLYSRKLSVVFIGLACLMIVSLAPVHKRLLDSSRDFFITGGRSDMWQVGIEIAERFPLGIGIKNSKLLHQYSTEIPRQLTHFHNNLINVLVEGGPLALILFLIWLWSVFKFCFKNTENHKLNPLFKASACAIISWQIVGLFEYNLGDSEVMFVLYVMFGAVAGAKKYAVYKKNSCS